MEALERRGNLAVILATVCIALIYNCDSVAARNHSMSYVCPPQFIRLGHSCYFFSENKATWQSALFFCKDRDSNLTVPARWEDRNLRNYLNKPNVDKASRWIGGIYDAASRSWKWGGELRPMHYQSFSKMKKLTPEQLQFHCIAMIPELLYRWAPRSCFEPREFICQTKLKKVSKAKVKELQKRYQRMGKINEITAPSASREVEDGHINDVTSNPVLNPKSFDLHPSPLRRGPKKNPIRNKTHGFRPNELKKRSRPHIERRLKRPFPGYQWNRRKPEESYKYNMELLLSGRTGLSPQQVKFHLSRLQRLRDRQLNRMRERDDWLVNETKPAIVRTHARTYTLDNNISALHPKTIVEEFDMLPPPAPAPVVVPRPTRGIW
ncbi:uncharacterized protein LOC116765597 [Danaus plexippus]|uniref:Uncharacterized protein n=1 Tax=Danaus plexippus plexippus TaxID=278856 RepID=A0A212EW16_DANPL|nr:uncharacterized protein LOC116765597 [Danaus plexippus]OWR45634.1 hypothetical protein KGM_210065 [Danaus plexippus plexippus]